MGRSRPRLISPKTSDLAEEMRNRAGEAKRKIEFETAQSGNSSGYVTRRFDFHEQLADERARNSMPLIVMPHGNNRIVWFPRPSYERSVMAIAFLFAARKSSVKHSVYDRARRMGQWANQFAMAEWERRMDRLANRWRNNLRPRRLRVNTALPEPPKLELSRVDRTCPSRLEPLEPEKPFSSRLPLHILESSLLRRPAGVRNLPNVLWILPVACG